MSPRDEAGIAFTLDKIITSTDDAIKVRYHDEDIWIPLSQVHEIHRTEPPTIVITPWIARKKGMIE